MPPLLDAPAAVRQPVLLLRLLAEAMIANVQNAARLNRSAAQVLIAQARLAWPIRFGQIDDDWAASQRGLDLCAQAADRMLGLAHRHIERGADSMAEVTELLLAEMSELQDGQLEAVHAAFEAMRRAQRAYLDASLRAQMQVLTLAGAGQPSDPV